MYSKIIHCILQQSLCWPLVFALYEQCNHVIDLQADQKIYINSPYYPQKYPVGTSCRYTVKAPQDYTLDFKCNIQLNTPAGATRCYNEVFYFNREGSELLTDSEYFCGSGEMRRKSFLNMAVISYMSTLPQVYKGNTGAVDAAQGKLERTETELELADRIRRNTSQSDVFLNGSNNFALTVPKERKTEALALDEGVSRHQEALKHVSSAVLSNFSGSNGESSTKTELKALVHSQSSSSANDSFTNGITRKRARIVVNQGNGIVGGQFPSGHFAHGVGGGTFSCLVQAVAAECECGWTMSATKVAGVSAEAATNEFPAMAGVLMASTNKIFCGASIISHHYLLSAAHCFNSSKTKNPTSIRVVVGEHDFSTVYESLYTRTYDIAAIIPHQQFRAVAAGVLNDIALLRTRIPMEWNRAVGPACLPFYTVSVAQGRRWPPVAGQRLTTAGWGTTSFGGPQSTRLLKTTLDVISKARCRRVLAAVPANTFCTFTPGSDTCQYDSGGALYAQRQQRLFAVGIVSFGYACATQKPSVNTKVALYLKWIQETTPLVKYCKK